MHAIAPDATIFLVNWTNSVLKFLHHNIGLSWGLSIVALTFLARALIAPLSVRQIRASREMAEIQPQMKEIQAKYKDDRERLQRETMALFKEHGVNPFASCLPLLMQMPIFIALLYTLRSQTFQHELNHAGWWFINDLSGKAHSFELVVLLVLYVVTQLIAGLIMTGGRAATGQQRMVTFGLPLVFAPIMINFPAGVVVYWIASNTWTMGQQAVIRLVLPPPATPTPEQVEATAKAPPPPPRKRKRRR